MFWKNLQHQHIVVPYDFSDSCHEAVKVALGMVEDPTHVHVLHVLVEISPLEPAVIWNAVSEAQRKEHMRKEVVKSLSDLDIEHVPITIGVGNPASAIADFAEKTEANLIVIPSRGRRGAVRWLLGSVAERVVHLAKCPVLVLKPQDSVS